MCPVSLTLGLSHCQRTVSTYEAAQILAVSHASSYLLPSCESVRDVRPKLAVRGHTSRRDSRPVLALSAEVLLSSVEDVPRSNEGAAAALEDDTEEATLEPPSTFENDGSRRVSMGLEEETGSAEKGFCLVEKKGA